MSKSESTFVRSTRERERNFTNVCNELIRDRSISPKAKGILIYLLHLPKDWKIIHSNILYNLNIGEDYLNSALIELINAGYMKRTRKRKKNGSYQPYTYDFSELKDFLPDGVSQPGFPSPGKPALTNTNIVNTKEKQQQTSESSNEEYEEEMPAAPVVVSSKSKISPKEMTLCKTKRLRPLKKYSNPEKIKVITPIVESLYKLNITDELRLELSQKYTKEEIDRAVQRVLAWEGRQCDAKAIRSVLKKKDTWDDSTSDNICYKSDNLLLLRSLDCLDSKQFGSTYISIYLDYIQFSCGQSYKTFKVSEKDFKNNVEERLKNLKIKMTK